MHPASPAPETKQSFDDRSVFVDGLSEFHSAAFEQLSELDREALTRYFGAATPSKDILLRASAERAFAALCTELDIDYVPAA